MESIKDDISEMKREIKDIKRILFPEDLEKAAEDTDVYELDECVCADLFKALSNGERLRILKSLAKEDQYFAQLKELTNLDHSPLRFHLTVLMDVNLIDQERFRGKYSITELGKQILQIATSFYRLMKGEGFNENL
ncbi:MAG: winged helix-turn-helix transcriptional regulator [Candidatus Methanofastidiosa archaeon]|nr:winged helix-turn-helix transcriptional regulator [Candidatus Methanofastidiosa archaeon]